MKRRCFTVFLLGVGWALVLTWAMAAHGSGSETPRSGDSPSILHPTPTMSTTSSGLHRHPPSYHLTILIWPKELSQFMDEYPSWELWLGSKPASPYALRDELLVSVHAIAAIVPDLEIDTDEPASDIIIVSGHPASISALLDRLRDHPLLAQVTEDSLARRRQARVAWDESRSGRNYESPRPVPVGMVNIRNNWVNNVVWGYSTPSATISVTLTRNSSHVLTTTTIVDTEGLYHAYLAWEIRDGDVIQVNDGIMIRTVAVFPMRVSFDVPSVLLTGTILSAPGTRGETQNVVSLGVVVGRASRSVAVDDQGRFTTDFSGEPFRPGTPGFLRCTGTDGSRIFLPFSVSIVNVRRDTSYGLPAVHSVGISSIVWGSATPGATLVITLTRPGSLVVARTVAADQNGDFTVSMDRLIDDGDFVQVFDGDSVTTVQIPIMTFRANLVTKMVTGTAPAAITTTESGAPHSFEISIAENTHQITTTSTGEFTADFTSSPYLAGLLGALRYTTPGGNRVYKPLFAADPLVRGKPRDWWADTILGQPDFSQITFNEVVRNQVFIPEGVHVDRSVQPNRVYVYDSGNSRVLGLSHLGVCREGASEGQDCTTDSDCPGSSCAIQEEKEADVVLGQPLFNTSVCNGDSGYQMYPDVPMANAATLCGLREEQSSVSEGGSGATMATDAEGNLYVPDIFNNRVLRYDNPFVTDTIADYVWGQGDFAGITCNRGAGFAGFTDGRSLCLAPPPGVGDLRAGVAIDSSGNLWVADNENNRVLRFPFSPTLGTPDQEADLVLGQPDFATNAWGMGLNQMHKPSSVRVRNDGVVCVADSLNDRVLVFEPPFSNGMSASRVLGSGLLAPTGLEIDPTGGVWVSDTGNQRIIRFLNEVQDIVILTDEAFGGLGVDSDGNVLATNAGYVQEVMHFSAPTYILDARVLRDQEGAIFNQPGPHGFFDISGLEVAGGQLIASDGARMLFWNNPWNLSNYQAADGVVGVPDFYTQKKWGPWFRRMRADGMGRLWVINGSSLGSVIYGYGLPLKTGATPVYTIASPLPVQGGGVFTWTWPLLLGGIDIQPECNCLWLSDTGNNRVFRIRNPTTNPIVDVVLGQKNISGMHCNQGRDPDDGYIHPISPTQDSLCHPGALAFDRNGNLFVADHNAEVAGNWRLLEWDADMLPHAPSSAVFGIPATRVFGRNGDFIEPNCLGLALDPMCGPFEPTFDLHGHMVIGFNVYLGPRFPMVYLNPLIEQLPVAALGDVYSWPASARFDQFDNLYVLDSNRSRILIYRDRQVQTYTMTGAIKTVSGVPVPGVQVETIGYASSGISDASGLYTLTGSVTGTYVLVPSKDHYTFTPVSRTVSVPEVTANQDFVAYYVPATATIMTPSNGTTVSEVATVTVEGTGARVELYLDDAVHGRAGNLPATWSWSTRQVANGLHTLEAVPYDAEGRIGVPHSVMVTVSNAPMTTTWLLAGLRDLTVIDLAVAPSDRQVLYAATETGSVHTTLDGGMFWTVANNGVPAGADLSSLAVSPNNSQVVYVGSESGGVYKSTNGGDSWSSAGLYTEVADLAIARSDEKTLYAVGSGVYRTLDGGISWTPVLTSGWFRSVAIDPLNAQTGYVGRDWPSLTGILYKTTNGGSSWVTRTVESLSGFIQTILIDPYDTETLFVGKLWGSGGVYKSTDGGLLWARTGLEFGFNTESLAMAPSDSQVLYAGNMWGGIHKTSDGGTTWVSLSNGLPAGVAVSAVAVDLSYPAVIYAGLSNNGVWERVFTWPVADFTASPTTGAAPLSVVFTNISTGDYTESLWDFGDEVTSTLQNPTHAYTIPGAYTVTLTVSGPGGSDTKTKAEYITVNEPVQEEYSIYLPLVLRNH